MDTMNKRSENGSAIIGFVIIPLIVCAIVCLTGYISGSQKNDISPYVLNSTEDK